jgi:hypothetical protein
MIKHCDKVHGSESKAKKSGASSREMRVLRSFNSVGWGIVDQDSTLATGNPAILLAALGSNWRQSAGGFGASNFHASTSKI